MAPDFASESRTPEESHSTERNDLCQLGILYPTKIIFRNEGGRKISSDGRRWSLSATSSRRVDKGKEGSTTDILHIGAGMMG